MPCNDLRIDGVWGDGPQKTPRQLFQGGPACDSKLRNALAVLIVNPALQCGETTGKTGDSVVVSASLCDLVDERLEGDGCWCDPPAFVTLLSWTPRHASRATKCSQMKTTSQWHWTF